ncbi:MAG: bifunctional glutamate N-acetyltransferase/amino-acid acetyltransferase ArgJ [Leptospiraceae bacterium]|nr:bifunctional glutamate N-acetyltransferase/amino-acid acetyltransferase ArgJ [Leptospiraceae bacterium]MCK6382382.1 bifunctional glutamate N-acetyltransferase/amino-acid acetyltransferase ArgJ [Leptospiraceae bacterium]NUM41179.1 bifunctional glutamate N-acetyltransferase/amino-acid acetyltransferase ArgJ [Leptospiraceae bacterium]
MKCPKGFFSFGRNIGIKDKTKDFAVIYSDVSCDASAVFTKNNFPGAPIIVGREHIKNSKLRAIVINSKNSNVATGERGIMDSKKICESIAGSLGVRSEEVLPSSTGVIGVPLPMDKILPACQEAKNFLKIGNLEEVAEAIMTTDTQKKISWREIQTSTHTGVMYGIAKGAGMIEPNMATMLSYILTDVKPKSENFYDILKKSVDKSFNCISIDSDTSTSDTVVLMSSGLAGEVEVDIFQDTLDDICIDLAKKIASDGEGATKLIELRIFESRDEDQLRKIGKSIINSPLIKTAIYGGDPNWGRFIMAIGKVFDEPISYDSLQLHIGGINVKDADKAVKEKLSEYLKKNTEIIIEVKLGCGNHSGKFWGCDLTEGYVKENAFYTT